jgi:glycosyltransferase involved in cell wall biosynthesis
MRIGLITGEYPPMQGGVGAFTHELGVALAHLGHKVHVITRMGSEMNRPLHATCAAGSALPGSSLTVHPVAAGWGWRSVRQIMALADRLSLDAVNIQYQAAAFDLHPAINFSSFLRPSSAVHPTVVTFHDLNVPYLFPKAGPLRERVVTLLARRADAAIATNQADELELTARRARRVERIPIGSNIKPTLPDDYNREIWRAGLGITPEKILLGFFGFFNERKGVETLIRALAALDPAYHLLFIGGTVGSSDLTNRAYADLMMTLVAQLGLSERVHFTGYVPATEVSAAFAAADLCVLPYADGVSFHHGTLMAALAHGQAIISTQPPIALPELVHGKNAWLVPPDNPRALTAAIISLAADVPRRQQLVRGATELSAQFSWDRIATRTAQLFADLRQNQ